MSKVNHISKVWPTFIGEFYYPEHEKKLMIFLLKETLHGFLMSEKSKDLLKQWKKLLE